MNSLRSPTTAMSYPVGPCGAITDLRITDKLPNCNLHERNSRERSAQSDHKGGEPDCTHSRTIVKALSDRDADIKSGSEPAGGGSPVTSSRWVVATHASRTSVNVTSNWGVVVKFCSNPTGLMSIVTGFKFGGKHLWLSLISVPG